MLAIDQFTPSESHLPPSRRTWAREIRASTSPGWRDLVLGTTVLELRYPNSGQCADPATKARHQYVVARGCLWRRMLPPGPLDQPDDATPWQGSEELAVWERVNITPGSPIAKWALEKGVLAEVPMHRKGLLNAFQMPPAHPTDHWADITGCQCPVIGCDQTLVAYEAGYVPGYRVCMTEVDGGYDHDSIRHRFTMRESAQGKKLVVEK